MEIWLQIVLTAAATLLGGTCLYMITKWIERRYIMLFNEIDEIRADITITMVFNANVYGNPKTWSTTEMRTASSELRLASANIRASLFKAKRTWLFDLLYPVKIKDLDRAGASLIGLSNTVTMTDFDEIERKRKEIRDALRIYV